MRLLLISLLALVLITGAANAATLSVHVAVGDVIGQNVETPLQAFAGGFASHLVLDRLPFRQVNFNYFDSQTRKKHLPLIVMEATLSFLRIKQAWGDSNRMWGILGGVAPDLIDGAITLMDRDRWFKSDLPLHQGINNSGYYSMSQGETMAFSLFIYQVSF